MIVFLSIIIIAFLLLLAVFRNYEKDFLRDRGTGPYLQPFLSVCLKIYDYMEKRNGPGTQQCSEWADAVYVREDPKQRLRLQGAKQLLYLEFGMTAAAALGIAVCLLPERGTEMTELARPEFGTTQSYELTVESSRIPQQQITVEVAGKEPQQDDMQGVFNEAYACLQEDILGENPSLEEIRSDLRLPASTIYGIRTYWKSKSPEIIDDLGRIAAGELPEEGVMAQLQVKLTYAAYEYYYELNLRVLPPEKNTEYFLNQLRKELDDRNHSDREAASMKLPQELEGEKVLFSAKESEPLSMLSILLLLLPVGGIVFRYQRLKEAYTNRNRQLRWDYPGFVFELGIMIQCGMTIGRSWERLVQEYEADRKKGIEKRYLFEEMIVTRNQIAAGQNEAAAYSMFGRRCREHCYARLGSCLEQNVRQGVAGLSAMLDQELTQALEQRKHMMLREGERMETRMLLPMFILLGLVMAILMIPAFMSM